MIIDLCNMYIIYIYVIENYFDKKFHIHIMAKYTTYVAHFSLSHLVVNETIINNNLPNCRVN